MSCIIQNASLTALQRAIAVLASADHLRRELVCGGLSLGQTINGSHEHATRGSVAGTV